MPIQRSLETVISQQLGHQKVLILLGTRRVGKTTLIRKIAEANAADVLMLQGEDQDVADLLSRQSIANYQRIVGNKKLVIIDEAQATPEIGMKLKLMIDNIAGITILVTGSSSFDLMSSAGEPLVGRQRIYQLYPIAQSELSVTDDLLTTRADLPFRLVYGSYPELWQLNSTRQREEYLRDLVKSYLLKDILSYQSVKGADVLYKLLQLLAYQVGNEVNTLELARGLQISKNTVDRYLDLLAKVFIIYPLSGFSRNLRKEVTKSRKWYFFDNGIRNALINDFSPFDNRNDKGQLWEQYILSERIKFNSYRQELLQYYFWRTYDQQEIDLIEVNSHQQVSAFECKWREQSVKTPVAFAAAYPDAVFQVIHSDNYLDWIT